jgi:hypothetical protein
MDSCQTTVTIAQALNGIEWNVLEVWVYLNAGLASTGPLAVMELFASPATS